VLSLLEGYEAVTSGGVVCVEHAPVTRLIRLTGPQRAWFLQNTITADIEAAEPGDVVESCLLDERGRVFAHFFCGITEEEIWISDEPAYGPRLAGWFVSRRFRTKVEIEERDEPLRTLIGASAGGFTPCSFPRSLGTLPIIDRFGGSDVVDAPFELYELLRIEAGVPRFGVDYGERTLPHEAGLVRTLATDKGCYVGQETVARLRFRGHVNKVLRTLRFSDEVATGTDLTFDGEVVGRVTSFADSPRLGPTGIGMVRVEPEEGSVLAAGDVEAVVGPLPEGTKVKAS
jgi:folate-binding protein YgfZ